MDLNVWISTLSLYNLIIAILVIMIKEHTYSIPSHRDNPNHRDKEKHSPKGIYLLVGLVNFKLSVLTPLVQICILFNVCKKLIIRKLRHSCNPNPYMYCSQKFNKNQNKFVLAYLHEMHYKIKYGSP